MDLVASADNIIVAMMHVNRKGESKLLEKCKLPITGLRCVKKIVTELAVIDIVNEEFVLKELAPGVTIDEVISSTEGKLNIPEFVPMMKI
jgi:3-oxoacid CoA-transferase B subunit